VVCTVAAILRSHFEKGTGGLRNLRTYNYGNCSMKLPNSMLNDLGIFFVLLKVTRPNILACPVI